MLGRGMEVESAVYEKLLAQVAEDLYLWSGTVLHAAAGDPGDGRLHPASPG
jgi:hypothetical protein